jgi:hypothetical protein
MGHAVVVLWLTLVLTIAHAQEVSVRAPTDRFVRPGEAVTLDFELTSPEVADVGLEAMTDGNWTLVVDPPSASLEPGVATTVTVTIEVPPDAPALARERVTLRVRGVEPIVEGSIELSVLEIVDLRLEAPTQAPVGVEGLRAVVVNDGNSARVVTVELRREDDLLASRELTVAAGDRVELRFDLAGEGEHVLRLQSPRVSTVVRTVRAILFGTPEPAPFVLAGSLTAGYGLEGDWQTDLRLRGRLSDFSSVDVLAAAPNWRISYAAVNLESGSARIGAGGAAPFRLDLPKDFGLAASYEREGLGLGGMIGVTGNDELSTYAAASWTATNYAVAAGGGLRAGEPVAALRTAYARDGRALTLTARYQQARINARLTADIREQQSVTNLRVQAREFLAPTRVSSSKSGTGPEPPPSMASSRPRSAVERHGLGSLD